MNDKKTDPENMSDLNLFQQSVADVRPLKQKKIEPHRKQPPPRRQQQRQNEPQYPHEMLSDEYQIEEVESGDKLLFIRPGLQHNVIKKLCRGQYQIDAELDLHGMIVAEAREELLAFIHACTIDNARCARIIHGKGHGSASGLPILKNRLNNWLRQFDNVLAFCSARPEDGGTGALYLLLKRHNRPWKFKINKRALIA